MVSCRPGNSNDLGVLLTATFLDVMSSPRLIAAVAFALFEQAAGNGALGLGIAAGHGPRPVGIFADRVEHLSISPGCKSFFATWGALSPAQSRRTTQAGSHPSALLLPRG